MRPFPQWLQQIDFWFTDVVRRLKSIAIVFMCCKITSPLFRIYIYIRSNQQALRAPTILVAHPRLENTPTTVCLVSCESCLVGELLRPRQLFRTVVIIAHTNLNISNMYVQLTPMMWTIHGSIDGDWSILTDYTTYVR